MYALCAVAYWEVPTAANFECRGLLTPSKQQNLITGLNLLRLLVQNRIAEFHTELELIPQQVSTSALMLWFS